MECLRLYVGCLPYVAQRKDLEQLFSDHHIPVKSIDISIDPFSGRNPGFCFVNFNTEADAADALQKIEGRFVRDRPVKIRLATPRRDTSSKSKSWWSHESDRFCHNPEPYAFDRWTQYDTDETWTAPLNEGRRLFVGGLPRIPRQTTVNIEMRKLFSNFNIQAVSKIISPHESTKYKPGDHHYCFVDLATAYDAEQAVLALNGRATPWGWKYRVNKSKQLPTKLVREQLGGKWPEGEEVIEAAPQVRNLKGNWRNMDNVTRPKPLLSVESANWRA